MIVRQAAEASLRHLLQPIQPILDDPRLTDLYINGVGAGRCFVRRGLGVEQLTLPYTAEDLEALAVFASAWTLQDIGPESPIVDAGFPPHHRVNIVCPPAVLDGCHAFSIRRPKPDTWTPQDLQMAGVFGRTVSARRGERREHAQLLQLYRAGMWTQFLELAVRARLNIVFSGAVGSGKTHNLRAFTHAIPKHWRIITIEDMHELINLPCMNVVHLLYSKREQSSSTVTASTLIQTTKRMGMQGIIMQELRDDAAFAYLDLLQSGNWGMTTTHADCPEEVFERIAGLVKLHKSALHWDETALIKRLRKSIHVVVHCVYDDQDGSWYVEQVYWEPGLGQVQEVLAAE